MKYFRWICVFSLLLFSTSGHSEEKTYNRLIGTFRGEDGRAFSRAIELDGVAGFVEGRASSELMSEISENSRDWIAGAMNDVASEWRNEFRGHSEYRRRVRAALKKRIEGWLPGEAKKIIARGVAGELPGGGVTEEAARIADRVWRKMDGTMFEHLDALAGRMIDGVERELRERYGIAGLVRAIDIPGMGFDVRNASAIFVEELSSRIGNSTVDEIRDRIYRAFDGELPPEAVDALHRGPREFEKYISEMKEYLPGKRLSELKDMLLDRPLLKIPSAAYAAILSASAARHYASAFRGVTVDLYELKRAAEVTKVMIWQVREKEAVNIDIMDIANLSRDFAGLIGAGDITQGIEAGIGDSLGRVEELTRRLDGMILDRVGEVRSAIHSVVDEIQSELRSIQEAFVSPVREVLIDLADGVQAGVDKFGRDVRGNLPNFSRVADDLGLPENWGALKPIDLLDGVGDDLADGGAGLVVSVADSFGKLGPLARILEVEKIPADRESLSRELDPVLTHNGEFVAEITDFLIPGRGLDIRFTRIYRARSLFPGELGWRWTHSYAERILPWKDGLTHIDDRGRKCFFKGVDGTFKSPAGVDGKLIKTPDGYEIVEGGGEIRTFDSLGRILSKADRFGNRIEFEYGKGGLLSVIEDVFGRRIEINRRADGLISEIVDFVGRRFRYEYDDRGDLIGAISPATANFPEGRTTVYRYSGEHLLKMAMDPRGNIFLRNRYDDEGRIVAQRVGDGSWMDVKYESTDDGGMKTWVTDSGGEVHLYEHDMLGHPIQGRRTKQLRKRSPNEDGSVKMEYNDFGQLLSEVGADGVRVEYEYHPYYDPDGDGVILLEEFDSDVRGGGYLKKMSVDGRSTSFVYDPIGNIVRTIKPGGRVTTFDVDSVNRVLGEGGAGMDRRDYAFDENDNLVAMISGERRVEYSYDEMDRLLSVKAMDGDNIKIIDHKYDDLGRLAESVDGEGDSVSFAYDREGRLISKIPSDGGKLAWKYGEGGELIGISHNDRWSTIERNGFGEIVGVVGVNGSVKRFIRDDSGALIASVDGNGRSDFSLGDGALDEFEERAIYPDLAHLSFHRGQGAASSAGMPNRPLEVSRDYGINPFNRAISVDAAFPRSYPPILPKITCLRFESESLNGMRMEIAEELAF